MTVDILLRDPSDWLQKDRSVSARVPSQFKSGPLWLKLLPEFMAFVQTVGRGRVRILLLSLQEDKRQHRLGSHNAHVPIMRTSYDNKYTYGVFAHEIVASTTCAHPNPNADFSIQKTPLYFAPAAWDSRRRPYPTPSPAGASQNLAPILESMIVLVVNYNTCSQRRCAVDVFSEDRHVWTYL
ncbi:hypothetical protein L226DRAFT_525978 [Lentinus tigrinus ALCF2SS1-7]|uniref:Uncharacterized protein n=1 Tax=Lentinus tigrinus ALCF2SS1-6 TaxID=1328759 RepID=A0A5C2RWC5_9APHY|nr:hypothetical protein L227DRAFT_566880 [Lentinus tigrinus ALCF2SS1-6]RPD70286.1 hypothetical protein L226DRAFT_525978 [Lentinus tigrinus ALCF2SS1-7]